jgi:ammonium transporter, Amt family
MKFFTMSRLAGLAIAVAVAAGPIAAAPAWAQDTNAPAVATATNAPAAAAAPAEAAPAAAPAGEIAAPEQKMDKGDVAWMLVSTALVLLMTIPGLALFYGGLVRQKNMLSVLMQVSTVTVLGCVTWALWGYSLAFTDGGSHDLWFGGLSRLFLKDLTPASLVGTFSTGVYIPELVFFAFQMTFAAITAALVLGSVAERIKFSAVVVFSIVWPLLVYYPIAHMVWWWAGPDTVATHPMDPIAAGFIWGKGAIDFAGGTVVHINAGIAALVACLILGPRKGYGSEPMPPHSLVMSLIGAGLLWVGWFGFNAGSNLEANGYAALAMVNTFLATAMAGFSWTATEWIVRGKPSMLGMASGMVAGLVAVTPAAGFAGPMGSIVLGLIVSPICLFAVSTVKNMFKYDDSLDAFGVHCIGGITGAIATGILVNPALGGAGIVDYTTCAKDLDILTCDTAVYNMGAQVIAQLWGVGMTLAWSGLLSTAIFFAIKYTIGLRVTPEVEEEGLDITEHGERAYHS